VHTPLAVRMVTISRKLKVGWLSTVSLATTVLLAALVTAVSPAPGGAKGCWQTGQVIVS